MAEFENIAVAVIPRDGKLLVARRSEASRLGGLWEFPGGKIKPGETESDTAVRECREELGCDVVPLRVLGSVDHRYETFGVRLHAVLCRLEPDQTPRPLAGEALDWVALDRLKSWPIPEANHALIDLIQAALAAET